MVVEVLSEDVIGAEVDKVAVMAVSEMDDDWVSDRVRVSVDECVFDSDTVMETVKDLVYVF